MNGMKSEQSIHFWLGRLEEAIRQVDNYSCVKTMLGQAYLITAKQLRDEALQQVKRLAVKHV